MICGKQIFLKKEAEAALKKNEKSRKQYRKENRYYYCIGCNRWHLSSHEYNEEITEIKLKKQKRWKKLMKRR